MAKKIMCIVISIIMLIGTVSLAASAASLMEQDDGWYWDVGWENLDYNDQSDWKRQIDVRFLFAYRRTSGYQEIDEEQLERNLSFYKDEIIEEYHAAAAQLEAATTEEEVTAANHRFFDLYVKMATPMDGNVFYENQWYEYRDVSKEKASFKFVIEDLEGNEVKTVVPGGEYKVITYVTTSYYPGLVTPGFMYDKNYVSWPLGKNSLTVYNSVYDTAGTFYTDWGYHAADPVKYPVSYFRSAAFMEDYPDGEDTYGFVTARRIPNDGSSQIFDNERFCSFQFTVNEDTPVGTVLNFWNKAEYAMQSVDEYLAYWNDEMGHGEEVPPGESYMRCTFAMTRAADPIEAIVTDESYPVYCGTDEYPGMQLTYENASVEVVSAQADLADYTALDAAVKEYEDTESSVGSALYTADTWADYTAAYDAATALARDLAADQQTTVDAATKALTDAKAALVENGVDSAVVTSREAADVTADVQVSGSPAAIRLTNEDGSLTINRADANIVPNDAGELWTVDVSVADIYAGEYTVSAMYGTTMSTKTATLSYDAYKDPHFVSVQLPNAYSEEGYKDRVYKGKNEIKVVTTDDVWKVQFVQNGSTSTYATDYTPYVDNGDGTRTWTINHTFGPVGDVHLDIRIRLNNTSFYMVSDSLDVEVVY